jgi:cytochrome c biogenesis protein CcmG, thiol:disulfide interchange protein DsbE
VQDVTDDARDFISEYGLAYPMLRDGEGLTRETFAIVGFPETFVLDRRGRITAVRRGPVDERFMRERVVPLLREKA